MTSHDFLFNCGKRLLPTTIDELARDDPDRAWASLPFDDWDLSKGYEDITYAAFANAINKMAWFIETQFGRSSDFETILYLGTPDVRYHMVEMAACKTGYKALFSSHLNTLAVHLSLMRQTNCKRLLSANGVRVDDLVAEFSGQLACAVILELDDLLDLDDRAPPYPYNETFEEGKNHPYLVLHSSGTTGLPKPIIHTHALPAAADRHCLVPKVEGLRHLTEFLHPGLGVRFLLPTSPYHGMSAAMAMVMSVFGGGVFVPGFRHHPVGASDICRVLKYASVTTALLTPWWMEDIARLPDAKEYIEGFDVVFVSGAILSPSASDVWAKYCRLENVWGMTELLTSIFFEGDSQDHAYVFFDTLHGGIEFRDANVEYVDEDGCPLKLYEMFIILTPESASFAGWFANRGIILKSSQPPFAEFRVGDLWSPHPDPRKAAYAWKFVGRVDDLVLFSSGVKVHPAPLERALSNDERVNAALLIGDGHRQPIALVELADGSKVGTKVAEELWDTTIALLNPKVPVHGHVARTHVIVVPMGSFVRTSKGNVARKQTARKLAKEIDHVYDEFGDKWPEENLRYHSIVRTVDVKVESSSTEDK